MNHDRIMKRLGAGYKIISLHYKSFPYTADFIIREGTIQRREGSLLGLETYYQSPESLIIAKLRMMKATRPRSRAFKDREDVKAILTRTPVDKRRILREARKNTTFELLKEFLR